LFADGKSFSVFPFKVVWKKAICAAEAPTLNSKPKTVHLQTAFSVSKRHFKKATDRNRVKRLMREAYRLQKNELQQAVQQSRQQLVVFILYVGSEIPEYKTVMEKMNATIKKLQRIINENPAANL
jgi:ribonuclease P protein component